MSSKTKAVRKRTKTDIAKTATEPIATVVDHKTGEVLTDLDTQMRAELLVLKSKSTDELVDAAKGELDGMQAKLRGAVRHRINLGLIFNVLCLSEKEGGKGLKADDVAALVNTSKANVSKFRKLAALAPVPDKLLPPSYENAAQMLTIKKPDGKPLIASASDYVELATKHDPDKGFSEVAREDVPEVFAKMGAAPPPEEATEYQKARNRLVTQIDKVAGDLRVVAAKLRGPNKKHADELVTQIENFTDKVKNLLNNSMTAVEKKKASNA